MHIVGAGPPSKHIISTCMAGQRTGSGGLFGCRHGGGGADLRALYQYLPSGAGLEVGPAATDFVGTHTGWHHRTTCLWWIAPEEKYSLWECSSSTHSIPSLELDLRQTGPGRALPQRQPWSQMAS